MLSEFDPLVIVIACSFGATFAGLACGFIIGKIYTLAYEPKKLKLDRQRTLKALTQLLESADKLNEDVDVHNAELVQVTQDISVAPKADSPSDDLQSRLLEGIAKVVQSNRKLENELVQSRFRLKRQAEELDQRKKEARTDPLCMTGNRKAYDETLEYMLSKFKSDGTEFALMLIDVDHFKRINDTFGHSVGDSVLIEIGNHLQTLVRPTDTVCRLGGDEFAILLDNCQPKIAAACGNRIRAGAEGVELSGGQDEQSTVVTLSMGLSVVRESDNARKLFERADRALYRSKSKGRNCLSIIIDGDNDAESSDPIAPLPSAAAPSDSPLPSITTDT